jgi:hypothetical protein
MLRRTVGRLRAANAALVATFVVLAGGGIALAAASGLAAPNGHAGPAAAFAGPSSEAGESEVPDTDEPETDSDEPKSGQETPSPSLTGLCHAVQAGATSNPGKAIENPAFSVLVHAAGGRSNLAAFCTDLIGPPKAHGHGKPEGVPGHGADGPHPGPNHSLPTQAHGHH